MVVMFSKKDTREPAAEPRPGPTEILLSFAHFTMSQTIRK
jgi:hypothetical protein